MVRRSSSSSKRCCVLNFLIAKKQFAKATSDGNRKSCRSRAQRVAGLALRGRLGDWNEDRKNGCLAQHFAKIMRCGGAVAARPEEGHDAFFEWQA